MKENEEIISTISYIKRSKNRLKLITIIGDTFKMPSELAEEMNLRINQISAILSDLKKENIVVCINENAKTGRFYQLTDKGKEAYELIKQNK